MSPKRILLIDDDPEFVELMTLRLEANQYAVSTALSGEVGVQKACDERPDLIIVDVVLPTMTGFSVLQCLRTLAQTDRIPVILLTGHEDAAAILNALDYTKAKTMTQHLTKPVSAQELLAVVARALSPRNADASTPR